MPHPARVMCKQITSENNFDIKGFLNNNYVNFWKNVLNYFDQYHSPFESGIFNRVRDINVTPVIEAITKLIPLSNRAHYKQEVMVNLAKCFAYMLHSDTPESIRTPSFQLILNIMEIVDGDMLIELRPAIKHIVPYIRFARNTTEMESIREKVFASTHPLTLLNTPIGSTHDGFQNFQRFLKWLNMNWAYKPEQYTRILVEDVLSIVYNQAAIESKAHNPGYGFKYPVLTNFHELTLEFFLNCIELDLDLSYLFNSEQRSEFIFMIFRQSAGEKFVDSTIFLLMKMASNNNLVDNLVRIKPSLFLQFLDNLYILASPFFDSTQQAPKKLQITIHNFIQTYLGVFLGRYDVGEASTIIENHVSRIVNNLKYSAFFMTSLLHYLVNNLIKDEPLWKAICSLVGKNDICAASVCKYSHYLASIQLPILFDINIDDTLSYCKELYEKVSKGKLSCRNLLLVENMELLIEEPHQFTMTKMHLYWENFQKYNDILISVPIHPINLNVSDEVIADIGETFLKSFDCYQGIDDLNYRQNLVSVIVSYYETFKRLNGFPPGVICDHAMPLAFSRPRLMKLLLFDNDPMIQRLSFAVYSQLFNTNIIKKYVDQQLLTEWYTSLCLCILSTDLDLSLVGIKEGIHSIMNGLQGASMIIPLILSTIENDITQINESLIGFLSSFPIFESEYTIPVTIKNEIQRRIAKQSNLYHQKSKEWLMDSTSNTKSRVIELIKRIHSFSIQFAWPAQKSIQLISSYLIHEIFTENPDGKGIGVFLGYFNDILQSKSIEPIDILRTIVQYSSRFSELSQKDFISFIEKVLDLFIGSSLQDDWEWLFNLAYSSSILLVTNSRIMYGNPLSQQFVEKLYYFITCQKPDNFPPAFLNFFKRMVDWVSLNFGAYPPHQTILNPTFTGLFILPESTSSLVHSNSSIIDVLNSKEQTVLSSLTSGGQFIWKFTPFLGIDKQPNILEIGLPTIEKPVSIEKQQEFSKKFSQITQHSQEIIDNEYALDIILEDSLYENLVDDINTTENPECNIKDFVYCPQPSPLTSATVLTALGHVQPYSSDFPKTIKHAPQVDNQIQKIRDFSTRIGEKIAIVYVNTENLDQNKILETSIEQTSPVFQEFILGLGWNVDMQTHSNYSGGLDTKANLTGKSSIFYANASEEIMFHVAPLIPSSPDDEQQVAKKKHVGNDHIQIIWCESLVEYDMSTISSYISKASIVIYPLQNGLFRVISLWKHNFNWFGPCRNEMIISKECLPGFVRATASCAQTKIWLTQSPFVHPLGLMSSHMNEVIKSCDANKATHSPLSILLSK